MPTRNVNLTDALSRFVDEEVASGRFQNASEVVRAGLRMVEQRQGEERARLTLLHRMLDEADRGESVAIDSIEDFVDGVMAELDVDSAAASADRRD